MRTGILGGTFNPPHNGHLRVARAALDGLGLDRLIVVPAGRAPHKAGEPDPGPEARFAMCETAFGGIAGAEVSRIEIDREGPSWTVDTLRSLAAADPDDERFLVLGEDMAADLASWRDPSEVVRLACVAWAPRPGRDDGLRLADTIAAVVDGLGGPPPIEIAMEPVDLSSTAVREGIAGGRAVDDLVPAAVLAMIERDRLYGSVGGGSGR